MQKCKLVNNVKDDTIVTLNDILSRDNKFIYGFEIIDGMDHEKTKFIVLPYVEDDISYACLTVTDSYTLCYTTYELDAEESMDMVRFDNPTDAIRWLIV